MYVVLLMTLVLKDNNYEGKVDPNKAPVQPPYSGQSETANSKDREIMLSWTSNLPIFF